MTGDDVQSDPEAPCACGSGLTAGRCCAFALAFDAAPLALEADGERSALIEHGTPGRISCLRTGSHIDPVGWRVDHITPAALELVGGLERRSLKLD